MMQLTEVDVEAVEKRDDGDLPEQAAATGRVSKRLFTRGWLALMDQGVISGTNFVTSLMVGRFLGKDNLGLLFVTISLFTILHCITDQLVHTPYLVRAPHMRRKRLKRYAGSMLLATALLTLLAASAIFISGLIMRSIPSTPDGLAGLLAALAIYLPGMMLREFIHNLLHNQLRQAEVLVLDATVSALQISLMFTFMFAGWLSVGAALAIIAFSATAVGLAWLPRLLHRVRLVPRLAVFDFAGNWPVGRWTLGSYLIGSSAPTVLPWLLTLLHGAEATGLLAACLTLFGIAQTFLRGLGKYMAPQLAVAYADGGHRELHSLLKSFAFYSLLAMSAISGLLLFQGEWLVQFVFGSEYTGTQGIMRTLAVGCLLQTLDVLVGNGLLALAMSNRNFWADCARFGTTVVLAFALIPAWGALGVALSIVLGMSSGLIVRCWQLATALSRASNVSEGVPHSPVTVT